MIKKSFIVFLLLVGCAQPTKVNFGPNYGAVAVMQGMTSATEAQFVVAVPKVDQAQIELVSMSTGQTLLKVIAKAIVYDHSSWKLLQFRFSELKPDTSYALRIKGSQGNWVDTREFKTFSLDFKPLRVAIVSCMKDDLKDTAAIWQQLQTESADFFLMIGDNAYADIGLPGVFTKMSAQRLWDRHMETRNKLSVFRWQKLVPVFATWDDHDFGQNNGGRDFELKIESQKVFTSFFPMGLTSADFSAGPGVARQWSLGSQNFILLDNRSFRSTSTDKNPPSHFGKEQTQWMLKRIKKNSLNWLVSGDQFFGGYHPFESFEGQHPKKFTQFLGSLRSKKTPTLFVSGDRHMSEIMTISKKELGQNSYEITSSPIHSSIYPGASSKHKNPRRLAAIDGQWNYVIVDVEKNKKQFVLDTKAKGLGQKVFFSKKLRVAR